MSRKHSEDDNVSGSPKFVRGKWAQQQRAAARKTKMEKTSKKTNDEDGKGKR